MTYRSSIGGNRSGVGGSVRYKKPQNICVSVNGKPKHGPLWIKFTRVLIKGTAVEMDCNLKDVAPIISMVCSFLENSLGIFSYSLLIALTM